MKRRLKGARLGERGAPLICASCRRGVMKAAAVKIQGGYYHPFECVDVALARLKAQLSLALTKL